MYVLCIYSVVIFQIKKLDVISQIALRWRMESEVVSGKGNTSNMSIT